MDERADMLSEKVPLDVDADPPEQNTSSTTTCRRIRPSVRKPKIQTKESKLSLLPLQPLISSSLTNSLPSGKCDLAPASPSYPPVVR
jgi:hypothetical protein